MDFFLNNKLQSENEILGSVRLKRTLFLKKLGCSKILKLFVELGNNFHVTTPILKQVGKCYALQENGLFVKLRYHDISNKLLKHANLMYCHFVINCLPYKYFKCYCVRRCTLDLHLNILMLPFYQECCMQLLLGMMDIWCRNNSYKSFLLSHLLELPK